MHVCCSEAKADYKHAFETAGERGRAWRDCEEGVANSSSLFQNPDCSPRASKTALVVWVQPVTLFSECKVFVKLFKASFQTRS